MSPRLPLTSDERNWLRSLLSYATASEKKRIVELIRGRPRRIPPAMPRLEPLCPHKPWPKQRAFLALDCQEAFYGGAAAGGKRGALLMAALQYIHVPGYAAL